MAGLLVWGVSIVAVVVMYNAAESDNRSGIIWGGVTFLLCFLCGWFLPLPGLNAIIGFALSFGALFGAKLIDS